MTHAAHGPEIPADPFPGTLAGRLVKVLLALLLAASAILLAG